MKTYFSRVRLEKVILKGYSLELKQKGEPINKIKWKSDRQGIYLLYYLFEKNIDNEGYSIKAEKFFGIDKNSATSAWGEVKQDNDNVEKKA